MPEDLIYGVSTAADGNMSLRWGDEATVRNNRNKFLEKVGLRLHDCVFTWLNHGVDIVEVGSKDKGKTFDCDAILVRERVVGLFMLTADCFPVVIYRPGEMLALVHLGYKGVGNRLVQKVIKKFGSGEDLRVIIGPGVRKESYIFDEVVQKDDPEWQPFLENLLDGRTAINLPGYIRKQLVEAGVNEVNIKDCGVDTIRDKNYFSHYRAVRIGESEGRFATVVMMENR